MDPQTPQPTSSQPTSQPNNTKTAISIVVVVILVLLLAWWYTAKKPAPSSQVGNAQVQEINLAQALSNPNSPPAWFPTNLPFELNNVTEQDVLNYPEQKMTVYSLAYNSARQMEELFAVYGTYFKDNQFTIVSQAKTAYQMMYDTTKGNEEVRVVIIPFGAGASVQVGIADQG